MQEQVSSVIDSKQAVQLIQKYGSPLYVYRSSIIQQKVANLLNASHGFLVSYALKANTNQAIVKLIREKGVSRVDVVSPGEICKALKCGYSAEQIMYTENFIAPEQIDEALRIGVCLNIGALDTIKFYAQKLSGKDIFIRVNPKVGAGQNFHVITGGPKSKFGIYETDFEAVKQVAKQHNIRIIGLHQHIGSNFKIQDENVFIDTTKFTFGLCRMFPDVRFINIGGGLGVKYRQGEVVSDPKVLYNKVALLCQEFCKELGRGLKVCIEPGRYLVADSAVLLCRLTAKKKTPQAIFYGTDTGFNHLMRPALYGSHHNISNMSRSEGQKETVTVCGNICQCTDVLGRNIELCGEIGDILSIQNVGAYGFCMSSNYNERPKPAEILINQANQPIIIRRRETYEDLEEKL